MLYLGAAALALLGPSRPRLWPLLLLGHAALLGLIMRRPRPDLRVAWDWYPLLLMPLLYAEIPLLNQCWGGGYRDGAILALERAAFGGQPARSLAAAFPSQALSELLHFCYLSYYGLIFAPLLPLYLRGRRPEFARTLLAVMIAFYLCYLCFIYYPVEGPRYLWPAPKAVPQGPLRSLADRILALGSSRGAAFPSAHMAIASAQSLMALRLQPIGFAPLILLTFGLGLGAIYGGYHYAVDILAGAFMGVVAVRLTDLLTGRHSMADRDT